MQVQRIANTPVASKASKKNKKHVSYETSDTKVKVASLFGSATGIALTLGYILLRNRKQLAKEAEQLGVKLKDHIAKQATENAGKIKPLPINRPEDLLKLAAGSVAGGITGGLLTDKKENAKAKIREGLQQFIGNISIPVGILTLNLFLLKKSKFEMPLFKETGNFIEKLSPKMQKFFIKKLNPVIKEVPKIGITLASLFGGLAIGNKIMNKVNDKIFKEKERRQVKPSDFSAHADDLCFASSFILKEGSNLQGVISRILPATFLVAGYEAGTHKADKN